LLVIDSVDKVVVVGIDLKYYKIIVVVGVVVAVVILVVITPT